MSASANAPILSFRDLIVWQRAIQFAKSVYALSSRFPSDERFGLTAQIRRAAVSVSSNIAEGHARQGREFVHFLSIARGSLAEVESQLFLAVELGFLISDDLNDAISLATEIRRMASSLVNKLGRS
ncbi:MAG TPA: four helix bundle protein [Gemmataceae bacterium]|jgi:four helix bundle protein|nr:four helix bundle protein [Gemmataceae bacterium]